MINIVIPMAGAGSRFSLAGYSKPKPFIDVLGKPMIFRVLENLACPQARYLLIVQEEHLKQVKALAKQLADRFPVEYIPVQRRTEGAACTVMHARKYINNDQPLVIANSDQIVEISFPEYCQNCLDSGWDGSIMSFLNTDRDPKWSYARLNQEGLVQEVQEKLPISDIATVGIYMFTKGSDFVNAAIDMIIANDRVKNEFYVCPVYNYAIGQGGRYGTYPIESNRMHGLGTPEDLTRYCQHLMTTLG